MADADVEPCCPVLSPNPCADSTQEPETIFSPRDRIGQLTMRNLEITDIRAKLLTYAQSGLIKLSKGKEMPQLNSGTEKG